MPHLCFCSNICWNQNPLRHFFNQKKHFYFSGTRKSYDLSSTWHWNLFLIIKTEYRSWFKWPCDTIRSGSSLLFEILNNNCSVLQKYIYLHHTKISSKYAMHFYQSQRKVTMLIFWNDLWNTVNWNNSFIWSVYFYS